MKERLKIVNWSEFKVGYQQRLCYIGHGILQPRPEQCCLAGEKRSNSNNSRDLICFYHQRFGDKTRKCRKPCNWPPPPQGVR